LDTYNGLVTAIQNELHRSDLAAYVPDWITLAESRINKNLRVRQMETSSASTMASGVIAVPTNYLSLKNAYISSIQPYQALERKTDTWIYDNYPYRVATGTPKFIAREGTNFIFGPYPDSNYVVQLVYWNRFLPLSTATNSIFTAYPGLWLFGALCESAPWLKDDKRIPVWEGKFKQLLEFVQDEDNDEFLSGGPMRMVAE
jgi:hypothetical protein